MISSPSFLLSLYFLDKELIDRALYLLKDEELPKSTQILLCRYISSLYYLNESIKYYFKKLKKNKPTRSGQAWLKEVISLCAELEKEIQQVSAISLELH